MTDSAPVSDIDLFDDQVLVDPYPALRDLGGVVRLPANNVYALTSGSSRTRCWTRRGSATALPGLGIDMAWLRQVLFDAARP